MKITGAVTYRGWENGPAWGTNVEVELTLASSSAKAIFANVCKQDIINMIDDLKQVQEELENAPEKNAWA
jgi:hypothetical protein